MKLTNRLDQCIFCNKQDPQIEEIGFCTCAEDAMIERFSRKYGIEPYEDEEKYTLFAQRSYRWAVMQRRNRLKNRTNNRQKKRKAVKYPCKSSQV